MSLTKITHILDINILLNYSKTSKVRTSNFRNTRKFELNFGHSGFREQGLFMDYFNKYLLNMCVRKAETLFDRTKTDDNLFRGLYTLCLPPYNSN